MPDQKKVVTLIAVLKKVKRLSDIYYDSKTYDNILSIFQRLNPVEQRVLLKGLIGIFSSIESQVQQEYGLDRGGNDNAVESVPSTERRFEDEEEIDPKSTKKKIKGLWWKISGAAILVVLLLTTSLGAFFITGENSLLTRLIHFVEVVKSVL